jgi:hypothetical protein
VGVGVSPWDLAPALVCAGAGLGMFLAPFFDIVLAGVEPHEYGSASGTLTAAQQSGSALGVAVLGTVFFGLLGGHVAAASTADAPALRAQLPSAGVTPAQQNSITAALAQCGHDRSTATDPAAVPASCTQLAQVVGPAAAQHGPAVASAVQAAGTQASKDGFSSAIKETLWTVVGLQAAGLPAGLPAAAQSTGSQPGRRGSMAAADR